MATEEDHRLCSTPRLPPPNLTLRMKRLGFQGGGLIRWLLFMEGRPLAWDGYQLGPTLGLGLTIQPVSEVGPIKPGGGFGSAENYTIRSDHRARWTV